MSAPGLIFGRSPIVPSGGMMLETLMRLTLPRPATSSALSKALSGEPPSALPTAAAAIVTVFDIDPSPLYRPRDRMQEESADRGPRQGLGAASRGRREPPFGPPTGAERGDFCCNRRNQARQRIKFVSL